MGTIVKPFTFAPGGTVTASELNSDFDTLYTEFNGNIDNANIKAAANINGAKLAAATIAAGKLASSCIQDGHLDYSSVEVLRSGPNLGGTNGVRMARGGKAFTFVAGTVSVIVTFSTDSDDGNPAFSATPRVTFGIEHAGANTYVPKITARTSTSVTVTITSSSGADVSSGTLHWIAMGNV